MSRLHDWTYRFKALWRRDRFENELDEELRFHLESEIERRVAAGESRASAERAARLDFGGPENIKEACRDQWGTRGLEDFRADLRTALRQLIKSPVFSLTAVASLAIGLGVATVVFSLVDSVLLKPLPFGEPERIVSLNEITPEGETFSVSDQNLLDFERRCRTLESVAGVLFPAPRPTFQQQDQRIRWIGQAVSASFFEVLGVQARIGRTFSPEEFVGTDQPRVVVLTDRGWRRNFNADPEIVGETILLDGESWTVIGVLPVDFRFASAEHDVFMPYVLDPTVPRGDHRLTAFARLAPGMSFEQADREVADVAAQLAELYPDSNARWGAGLVAIDEYFLGPEARRTNFVLLGAMALLLLLACVNVSNLLLARAEDRANEIRLRLALGAGRGRVVRQLLTESLVLGSLGALGAALLAWVAMPWVRSLDVALPRMDQMALDWRILASLALVAVVVSLLLAVIPALRATSQDGPRSGLRYHRHGADPGSARMRAALVMAEVALATVLALGAGLLYRSFELLQGVDSGFATDGILLAQIDLPAERYPESSPQTRQFFDGLHELLEAQPGVESVGATMVSPFRGPRPKNNVAPEAEVDQNAFVPIHWRGVTPGYFQTLRIPLLRGRSFDKEAKPSLETVISSGLAQRLWPGEDPVGRRMRWISPEGPLFEVIGVVGEIQDLQLGGEPLDMVYLPQRIMGWPTLTIALRTSGSLEPLAAGVRAAVDELDPLLAPPEMSTLATQRREALARPLLSLRLVAVSALIAVLLAAVGVYGLVAYAVSRRRRELGVRVAVGARPRQVVTLVAWDAARLIGGGLVLGWIAALALAGTVRVLLYQVSPFDPRVTAYVALLLAAVGLLACALPASRAARVDPVTVLRQE